MKNFILLLLANFIIITTCTSQLNIVWGTIDRGDCDGDNPSTTFQTFDGINAQIQINDAEGLAPCVPCVNPQPGQPCNIGAGIAGCSQTNSYAISNPIDVSNFTDVTITANINMYLSNPFSSFECEGCTGDDMLLVVAYAVPSGVSTTLYAGCAVVGNQNISRTLSLGCGDNLYIRVEGRTQANDEHIDVSISATGIGNGNSTPIVDNISATPLTICPGDDVQLDLDVSNCSGCTYEWSGPNGFFSTLEDPIHLNPTGTAGSSATYIVTITSPSGCQTFAGTGGLFMHPNQCGPCPDFLALTNSESGTDIDYEVKFIITSDQQIMAGAQVDYDAYDYIILTNGFSADAGSDFHAFIDGCGGNQIQDQTDTK